MNCALADQKIVFIGAGSMAEAIVRGLTSQEIIASDQLYVINRQNDIRLAELRAQYHVRTSSNQAEKHTFIENADIIILAMKPKDVGAALLSLTPYLHEQQLLISMVAGLSIRTIEHIIGRSLPIARTMPNTSSAIGFGATGISFSDSVESHQQRLTVLIFQSIGAVCTVAEQQMNLVTGVSGSGPAYIYYMMEAMIHAAIEGGLSPETAQQLTVQTVLGAAQMVKTTLEDPALLRRKVTSPGGTTQAALDVLDLFHFPDAIRNAIGRAAERAAELGAEMAAQNLK